MTHTDDPDDAGRRVALMVDEGKAVCADLLARYDPVAVVAAFSGGNDSVVATHFAMTHLPGCSVFHADTLVGLAPAREHVRAVAARYGWPMEVGAACPLGPPKRMRAGGKLVPFDPAVFPAGAWTDGATAYEEFVLNWGFPGRGRPQHARMYQRLKERSIQRLIRSAGGSKAGRKVLFVSGVRHDESAVRAGYKRAYAEGHFGDLWVNPFYHRTAADFAAYRDEFGLPENPVKRRCGVSGECCCGTFQHPGERAAYREIDPAFEAYLCGLEARARSNGFPWGWGESPPRRYLDARKGQTFFPFDEGCSFQPMCVGCVSGRR